MEEFAQQILSVPFETYFGIIVFGGARIYGLLYSFYPLSWGFFSNGTIRIAIAVVMGIPIVIWQITPIREIVTQMTMIDIILLLVKEMAIGYGLGLIASSPFRALQYAGGISDTFRGEQASGSPAPDGNQIQTFSVFYLLIGFTVFISLNGFAELFAVLYSTYDVWPVESYLPGLAQNAGQIALYAFDQSLQLALIIAAPLMILMLFVEITLIVTIKIAKRFNLYERVFLLKNLVVIVTLPLTAMAITKIAAYYNPSVFMSLEVMRGYLE